MTTEEKWRRLWALRGFIKGELKCDCCECVPHLKTMVTDAETRAEKAEKDRDMWKEEFENEEEFNEDYVKKLVAMEKKLTEVEKDAVRRLGLLKLASGIIANVNGGDWMKQSEAWRETALYWRNDFLKECTDERRTP